MRHSAIEWVCPNVFVTIMSLMAMSHHCRLNF